jgi:ATP-dependent Clp protease protease subunit
MIFNSSKFKKLNDEEDLEEEEAPKHGHVFIKEEGQSRLIGLYGEVEELKVSQIIGTMLDMVDDRDAPSASPTVEAEEKGAESTPDHLRTIEFVISTPGGNADDMFALYDIMRVVREKCDITTYGIGKVMSAGVLLLASGTKGKRKIGKNCRVMIHSVVAGSSGSLHSLQNEMLELEYMQKAYIKALSEETTVSVKTLNNLINKKVNVYLSAEQAVEMGIADIIV